MNESISFDRAATFYDKTRKLEDRAANAITAALLDQVRSAGAERLLEIGVGTGRMSRPLMRAGVSVVGVDISREMVGQLRDQLTPEHARPELLLGDATRLPFGNATFRAALAVHVFHLVSSPEEALAEVRRVLEPDGVLLQQVRRPDGQTDRLWKAHDEFWDAACAARGFQRRKQPHPEDIERLLRESGATLTDVPSGAEESGSTVDEELARIRNREHSWTWLIPDEIIESALPEYEVWLRSETEPEGRWVDRVDYVVQVARWR